MANALASSSEPVRKLRFAAAGTGKRGGGRVVYYYLDDATPVYALLAYAKSARTDLAPASSDPSMERAINAFRMCISAWGHSRGDA